MSCILSPRAPTGTSSTRWPARLIAPAYPSPPHYHLPPAVYVLLNRPTHLSYAYYRREYSPLGG